MRKGGKKEKRDIVPPWKVFCFFPSSRTLGIYFKNTFLCPVVMKNLGRTGQREARRGQCWSWALRRVRTGIWGGFIHGWSRVYPQWLSELLTHPVAKSVKPAQQSSWALITPSATALLIHDQYSVSFLFSWENNQIIADSQSWSVHPLIELQLLHLLPSKFSHWKGNTKNECSLEYATLAF